MNSAMLLKVDWASKINHKILLHPIWHPSCLCRIKNGPDNIACQICLDRKRPILQLMFSNKRFCQFAIINKMHNKTECQR